MNRPCIDCGRVTRWSRCPAHAQARQRARDSNRTTARIVVVSQPWCSYCGSTKDLTSDHLVPLSKGGSNARSNQITACRSCNSRRGEGPPLAVRWRPRRPEAGYTPGGAA